MFRTFERNAPGVRRGSRLVAVPAALALTGAVGLATGPLASAGAAPLQQSVKAAASPSFALKWHITASSSPIAQSSPVVANLPGGPAVVVGDTAGNVVATYLSTGGRAWAVANGGIGITGALSAGNSGKGGDSVYVPVGTAAHPSQGYYEALTPKGAVQWKVPAKGPSTDPVNSGVASGMAFGTLQGQAAVVSGSMGQNEYALNAASGGVLGGFPWLEADSNFSTPAIADIEGNGTNQIIEGGDSTGNAVVVDGEKYNNGGHIRILSQTGHAGATYPNGGLVCQYDTNQVVQSSPAVGQFLGGKAVGAVVGTGTFYSGASQTNELIAITKNCGVAWQAKLDGATTGSPALADVLGNGQLQVVEGAASGSVYALNGSNGAVAWHAHPGAKIVGSVVTADLGGGYQDVIVPTINGVYILNGKTGATIATLATSVGVQNAPLVTKDPNGTIGLTIAGYNGNNQGVIYHYEVAGSNGSKVNEAGAWPEFHHDAALTGNAGTPPPVINVPCTAPKTPAGYRLAASDGGMFDFGNLPFCGSTGNITLNKPIVGTTSTASDGGYWLVASDGGIFAFGDGKFYGSEGGHHLNQPIVGMAATPTGKGYWLVARDGGIFTFGDAKFYGSEGGHHLNQPIVGMTATPNGKGYYLVARDGGIFTFGNATFAGSEGGHHLNQPIVGMATDPATGGYWMVASDGGVFSFNAPFFGSEGGHHLNKPIVGMAVANKGKGYRFVASDGGIFTFGDAKFYGSEGGHHLNKPIVTMAS